MLPVICDVISHVTIMGTCELEARMLSFVAVVGSFNTRYFVQSDISYFVYFQKIIFSTNKKFNASVMSQTRLMLWSMYGAVNL